MGAPGHPLRLRGLRESDQAADEPAHDGVQGDAAADGHDGSAGEAAHRGGAVAGERPRGEEGVMRSVRGATFFTGMRCDFGVLLRKTNAAVSV